jgi:hypothetical protein
MTTAVCSRIAASFPTRGQAEAAIDELYHMGFPREGIGIAAPNEAPRPARTPEGELEEKGGRGATIGAAAGGIAGALVGGLVAASLPGIGPVLTGGLLSEVILATAAGAAAGSYLGPFVALGMSEQDAKELGKELKTGRTLVFLKSSERTTEAVDILHHHGGRLSTIST